MLGAKNFKRGLMNLPPTQRRVFLSKIDAFETAGGETQPTTGERTTKTERHIRRVDFSSKFGALYWISGESRIWQWIGPLCDIDRAQDRLRDYGPDTGEDLDMQAIMKPSNGNGASAATTTTHSETPRGPGPTMTADAKIEAKSEGREKAVQAFFDAIEYASVAAKEAAFAAKEIQEVIAKGKHAEAVMAELAETKRTNEKLVQEKTALEKQVRTLTAEKATMTSRPGGAANRDAILTLIRRKIEAAKDIGDERAAGMFEKLSKDIVALTP
jgi:cell division protein FtsB